MEIICAACGTDLDQADASTAAGPYGCSSYCRDVAACRERRAQR